MSRYLNHRNDPQDLHYRNFLTPIKTAMLPYLKPGQNGLDFGSGPGPTLSVMFQEEGYKMETFDLFFNNDEQTLKHKYDFIVSTETVEHFDNPMKEFVLLSKLLKSKGTLGIMTSILYRHIKFSDWYYILDPTHVGFYSPETFEYIGNLFKYTLYTPTDNVYIFTKNV
jgi:cyclopropane fatty-acyl-phospholipid synthase-like methyltransferase